MPRDLSRDLPRDLFRRAVLPAVLPVAAVAALLLGAPSPVPGLLALAGLALAADRLARLRSLGLADRVLVAVGGGLVAVVLAGMVLGSTSIGLSPTTWTVTLAVLAATGLLLAALLAPRADVDDPSGAEVLEVTRGRGTTAGHRLTALALLPWLVGAGAVVTVAVGVSAASLARVDRDPVEMSLGRVAGNQVEVVVRSSEAVGPLEVRTETEGNEVSYPLFTVPEDGSVTTTVALPSEGRFVIALSYPDQTQPLRSLVLDR